MVQKNISGDIPCRLSLINTSNVAGLAEGFIATVL
jgi:hypothetical protein